MDGAKQSPNISFNLQMEHFMMRVPPTTSLKLRASSAKGATLNNLEASHVKDED